MSRLENIFEKGNRGHIGRFDNNQIECKDGTQLSVIAGGGTYCSPRPAMCTHLPGHDWVSDPLPGEVEHDYPGPYHEVEVMIKSRIVLPPEWERHCDGDWNGGRTDPDDSSVWGYVPVELVRRLVLEHGGEHDPDAPKVAEQSPPTPWTGTQVFGGTVRFQDAEGNWWDAESDGSTLSNFKKWQAI
jgi:hypothetical protein